MGEPFDPYYAWLGIPPKDQPPNHYRLLGLDLFERESRVIELAGDRQMMHLRTFQSGQHSADSQRLLNEVAQAKIALLNPGKKAAYDRHLRAELEARKPKPATKPAPEVGLAAVQTEAAAASAFVPQLTAVPKYKSARKPAPQRSLVMVGAAVAAGVVLVCLVVYIATSKRAGTESDATVAESSKGDPSRSSAPPTRPTKSRQPAGLRKVDPPEQPKFVSSDPVKDPPKDLPQDPPKDPPPTDPPVPEPKVAPPSKPATSPGDPSATDILALIDPATHRLTGTWKKKGTELQFNGKNHGRILVPVMPQGSYEWTVELTCLDPRGGGVLMFPAGGSNGSAYFELGATEGQESGLGRINGARANDAGNPTRRACDVAVNVRHKVVLRVQFLAEEKVDVSVLVDGKDYVRWKGLRSALAQDPVWKLPKSVGLALGTTQGVVFHSSQLRMLDGKLARLEIRRPESGPSLDPDSEPPPEVVTSTPTKEEKQPVPEGEVAQRSAAMVRDLYKTEIQEAKTEQQKSQLAGKVLQRAEETRDDPAGRYALLRLAYDLALEAADGNLALDAVDRVAALYLVTFDLWERKAEIVGTLAKQARRPEDHKAVVQLALAVIAQAQADDAFAVAQQLGKLATATANKARDHAVLEQARASVKQVEQAAKAFQEVQTALESIKQKPDDGASHLTVGHYYCFVKGDWETGLPHLAKSSDAALAQAAGDDLKAGADSAAQVKVADAWWDLSDKTRGAEQDGMRMRAGFWYKQLLAEAGAGLLRARIEKRLEEVAQISRASPAGKMKRIVVNVLGMKLAFIPAGEFRMGSPDSDTYGKDVEKPQHRVRISRPFYVGVYEVTQAEFLRVMGRNPSYFSAGRSERAAGQDTSRYPVDGVSFRDALEFCVRLSRSPDEMRAGRAYRLPTEAEWEYACRAGTTTAWSCGDKEADLGDYAWTSRNASSSTHRVGEKKPNPWGLYDMHGNVAEWCLDWFDKDYYKNSPVADPPGPVMGQERVMRGGDLYSTTSYLTRSAHRAPRSIYGGSYNGFRVVMIPAR